eukprot:CAMPEP_0171890958 /NCGR_PEP_ID=MMETSP0992-20121227/44470_1 /TAXON_ID=483369 /ORGANISM="non described non described, Strain CCMP2098" /LENGTH=146 /DNA_ID=CAMNT_0012518235 /DNA_START=54 /DNA_END=493 /DNA_ORIENTATION=+
MAHAGAIFKMRGRSPLMSPLSPSSRQMARITVGVEPFPLLAPPTPLLLLTASEPTAENNWRRVFTTSIGVVSAAARVPAAAPATKAREAAADVVALILVRPALKNVSKLKLAFSRLKRKPVHGAKRNISPQRWPEASPESRHATGF